MTDYAWKIETIETAHAEDGLADVAKTVHWRMNAQDGEFSATAFGSVGLDAPDAAAFTAFDSLTPETVVGWVVAKIEMSEDELKAALQQRIENDKNPPVVNKLPAGW
jgi:hypothetical protein